MLLKDTFVYDRHNLISCMCMPWKVIDDSPWLSSLYEWKVGQRPQCMFREFIASKKQNKSYLNKNKQTHLASTRNRSLQEMKMPAWNCHHIESKPTLDLVIPPQLLYL